MTKLGFSCDTLTESPKHKVTVLGPSLFYIRYPTCLN